MPDINLNSQGIEQNFSVQDNLPFRLVFTKGSSFPTSSCAIFRLQYTANDPRLPQQQLYQQRSYSRSNARNTITEIRHRIYQGTSELVELKTNTDNGGLFTMNKNSGTITLDYPRDMTTPKEIMPTPPIPDSSPGPLFFTAVIDNRSMAFTSAKYELFVLIDTILHRPLYGTITRNLAHIPQLRSPQC